MSDLTDLFRQLAEEKAKDPKYKQVKKLEETVKANARSDLSGLFSQLSSISKKVEDIQHPEVKAVVEEVVESAVEQIAEEVITEVTIPTPIGKVPDEAQVPDLDKYLKPKAEVAQEDPLINQFKQVNDKLKFLERWVGQIQNTGPGSGEVNFRYLDDVVRSTMLDGNDNWVLEYDATSKKVQFTKDIGPIDSVQFDITHVDDEVHPAGTLCWNAEDMTLNLHHPQGSRQQIGQEQYYPPVRNLTGSDIPNGTVVMFTGAEEDNSSRLLIGPMIANGTYPSLYTMGVVTAHIANGAHGFVTNFGYVNDLDTSMWNKGDILYADPAVPGGMTNVKPTSPNACVVIAAVVHKHTTLGRIMVRPTYDQKMLYGRFASTITQIPAAIDTPYALDFNISEVERGFHRDGNGLPTSAITAEESGYYSASAILSLTSTNSSAKAFYVWLRKNGVDVPLSARRQSVTGNGTYQSMIYRTTLSLNKGDYFQIMYAANDTTIQIDSPAATSFCPAVPAATLLVTQVAL